MQPLIDNGLNFVVATGRTRDNAIASIYPLKNNLPLICDNGTFIYDTSKKKYLLKSTISNTGATKAIDLILQFKLTPFINTLDKNSIVVYYSKLSNVAQKSYYLKRSSYGLSQYVVDASYTSINKNNIFNISMLDRYDNLIELYNILKENKDLSVLMFSAHYYKDFYWLEILPANSGKGQAVDFLIKKYLPKKVICFGDNLNDLSMFSRANIKVAPSNAVKEIIDTADIIIGHCDDDSVAKYIKKFTSNFIR